MAELKSNLGTNLTLLRIWRDGLMIGASTPLINCSLILEAWGVVAHHLLSRIIPLLLHELVLDLLTTLVYNCRK